MLTTRLVSRGSFTRATLRCVAAASLLAVHGGGWAQAPEANFARGRILVMPKAGLPEAALAQVLQAHGGGAARRIGKSELRIVDLPPGLERQLVRRLAGLPEIKFAELDEAVVPGYVPNDPMFGSQWHLSQVGAVGAWDLTGGANITIAILDSGVDSAHPDLAAQMVPGWNFYDNNADTSDVFGHGTMVAGTAAATMANGAGVAGIAGRARIMPIRITDTAGSGYFSAAASGLTFAADNGARVANMSFSGLQRSAAVISAAQYFRSKGGVVTVSAGNSGTEVTDIAASDAMIAVSATDSGDNKTSWSSWGAYVDVSAPGAGIYTTTRGGSYSAVNGTSFAAPLTAGVVALMMAAKPGLTGSQVEGLLMSTAVDLGSAGKDPLFGTGRVDAHAAVLAAFNSVAPGADTQPPAVAISRPLGSSTVSGQTAVDVSATDNVAVAQVELWANGARVAVDSSAPFAFSWDTTRLANGMVSLTAVARDAAGNTASSAAVAVNVANAAADTAPPTVAISNPTDGSRVSGNVSIQVRAADASGPTGLTQTLYIDNKQVAKASGTSLSYSWNTKKAAAGSHVIRAIARDAAGNEASTSVQVIK